MHYTHSIHHFCSLFEVLQDFSKLSTHNSPTPLSLFLFRSLCKCSFFSVLFMGPSMEVWLTCCSFDELSFKYIFNIYIYITY